MSEKEMTLEEMKTWVEKVDSQQVQMGLKKTCAVLGHDLVFYQMCKKRINDSKVVGLGGMKLG